MKSTHSEHQSSVLTRSVKKLVNQATEKQCIMWYAQEHVYKNDDF